MDTLRTVTMPLLKKFCGEEFAAGVILKTKKRGAPPKGGGEVFLRCPVVRQLQRGRAGHVGQRVDAHLADAQPARALSAAALRAGGARAALAIASAVVCKDGYFGGEASDQAPWALAGDPYLHGHTLRHLHPVARRVLRREHGKL